MPIIDLHLVNVSTRQLTFEWSEPVQCSSIHYRIIAKGCGMCPSYTPRNSITCIGVHIDMEGLVAMCSIAVKVSICERNTIIRESDIVNVVLRG